MSRASSKSHEHTPAVHFHLYSHTFVFVCMYGCHFVRYVQVHLCMYISCCRRVLLVKGSLNCAIEWDLVGWTEKGSHADLSNTADIRVKAQGRKVKNTRCILSTSYTHAHVRGALRAAFGTKKNRCFIGHSQLSLGLFFSECFECLNSATSLRTRLCSCPCS